MKRIKGIRGISIGKTGSILDTKSLPLPKRVVLPLDSQWGNMAPLVQKGDRVLAGRPIAEHPDGLLTPLYASISGTVSEIGPWSVHSGSEALSIVIESDGEEAIQPFSEQSESPHDVRDILRLISRAGIREVDAYSWPLPVRISQPALIPPILFPFSPDLIRPVEILIINGMDRQPGVWLRSAALAAGEQGLVESIGILKRISSAGKAVLAVSKNQQLPDRLESVLSRTGVEVVRCPDKYPAALEPMLVQYITGREIPQPLGDARAVGAVVVDVITALRLLETVRGGRAAVETAIQVSAPSQGLEVRVNVREGTLLEELLSHVSPLPESPAKAIVGGPFLGYAQHQLQVPITQKTDSVILQNGNELSHYANQPCINCGDCVRSCPMRLLPNELSKYCEYGDFHGAQKIDLFHCIECGICSYVCPARRPMVHLLRYGKQELSALREES